MLFMISSVHEDMNVINFTDRQSNTGLRRRRGLLSGFKKK